MTRRRRHPQGRHRASAASRRIQAVSSLLIGAMVVFALFVVAAPLVTHGEWRTVQTGSMEPLISAGDVVLVNPTAKLPSIGDIIAFPDPLHPDRDVLHRVADIDESGALITKGDANDVSDPWQIDPSEVIGVESLTIPAMGFLVEVVSSDAGIAIFLALPALVILISESRVWYRFIRYGSEAFDEPLRGRHVPRPGRHIGQVAA